MLLTAVCVLASSCGGASDSDQLATQLQAQVRHKIPHAEVGCQPTKVSIQYDYVCSVDTGLNTRVYTFFVNGVLGDWHVVRGSVR